jgi:hypothetical protein
MPWSSATTAMMSRRQDFQYPTRLACYPRSLTWLSRREDVVASQAFDTSVRSATTRRTGSLLLRGGVPSRGGVGSQCTFNCSVNSNYVTVKTDDHPHPLSQLERPQLASPAVSLQQQPRILLHWTHSRRPALHGHRAPGPTSDAERTWNATGSALRQSSYHDGTHLTRFET